MLADGKPRPLNELVEAVEKRGGLIPENVVPGRSIHMALVNLKNQGYAKRENDVWMAVR